jgi:biopolymer transport protein TolR
MGRMSDINVTPYIDILLVMLIIFMVITPFGPKGMDVRLPDKLDIPAPADIPMPFAIVVAVDGDGGFAVNREPVGAEALANRLQDLIAKVDRYQLFVGADRGVPYADVVRAIDAVRGVSPEPVALMLTPAR